MNEQLYADEAPKRVAHIKSHLAHGFKIEQLTRNVEDNLGNPLACTLSLSGHAEASAMLAWFERRDLESMRQWCYVASLLKQRWRRSMVDRVQPANGTLQLLLPLLSNNHSQIDWFANDETPYDARFVEDHKTHDFWAYQAIVAMRGEWARLIERCERVITDPPKTSAEQRYQIDHRFYLALARQDVAGMHNALLQITEPSAVRARSVDDSGYTANLISTAAVIYAKIASRHGYRVEVGSRYVPAEWLSIEPLRTYEAHYRFLE